MNTAWIRQQLHEYIDSADTAHLTAMFVLFEKQMPASTAYDEDTLDVLYKRVEADLEGQSRSYTVNEALEIVRRNRAE